MAPYYRYDRYKLPILCKTMRCNWVAPGVMSPDLLPYICLNGTNCLRLLCSGESRTQVSPMAIATVTLICNNNDAVAQTVSDVVASTHGCQLCRVDSGDAAWLACEGSDLILVWLGRNDDTVGCLARLRDNCCAMWPIPVVALTDTPDPDVKLGLFQMGVVDCLSTPIDVPRLAFLVDVLTVRQRQMRSSTVRERQAAFRRTSATSSPEASPVVVDDAVFAGEAMAEILKQCHALAPFDTTILITGETGTGKTHLARLIHELSPRKSKPFLTVACGALTSSLVTSELFGHVRGAFTGADTDQVGKLVAAEDGTVLLDDIDCLSLETQMRLLRAVDDHVVEPVGSNHPHRLRARLIVASNRLLEEEVEAGRLRADLYYRINVANLVMPPLREQPEMIRPLVNKFLAESSRSHGRQIESISYAAMTLLEAYPFPGNIRELHNVIERAVVTAEGKILDIDDLPKNMLASNPAALCLPAIAKPNELGRSKSQAEYNRLVEALRRQHNNRCRVAEELGISRVTLYRKLRQYDLM